MNTQVKAILCGLMFTPIAAMASENFEPGDWLYDIYSGAFIEESKKADVAMDDINKIIEQRPTAMGAHEDPIIQPVNLD